MARKFKIGDAVRVVNPRSIWDRGFIGKTGKVIETQGRGYKIALTTGSTKYFQGRELEKW